VLDDHLRLPAVPRVLVQYGPSRTATTFQFQSLCAAAVLLSRREGPGDQAVDCFFTVKHLDRSKFSSKESKAAIFTANGTRGRVVIKTHKSDNALWWAREDFKGAGGAWLFVTSAKDAEDAPTALTSGE
jgi:hypothetical protein